MINRRNLLGAAAAAGTAITSALTGRAASAQTGSYDLEPRGSVGRLERLPSLDVESRDDFLAGYRIWQARQLGPSARDRCNAILAAHGLNPRDDIPLRRILELVADDPLIGTQAHARVWVHNFMHENFQTFLHANADGYLEELAAADTAGPGTLELNPEMDIPEYATHEIHTQPGGYVGEAFAGHIYHYSTNNFYARLPEGNDQDELHASLARDVPLPADGQVRRILDLGCGIGQLTVALKERFPEAEVWGLDIGAPMLRYGHMRAVDLGVDVHYAQRLAEDTRFPDGHFDMVVSYILHHEVPAQISQQIVTETHRILRPGGFYFPIDFYTGSKRRTDAFSTLGEWRDHRWNNEVWRMEYAGLDFPQAMRQAGFDVNEQGPAVWRSRHNLIGVKPA